MAEIKQERNILKQGINGNDGEIIQNIISQNLKNARFAFLAKITSLNGNKISVCEIARRNDKEQNPIINNVLVAQPKSGKWRIQFDLKVGDIGLCVCNDSDLSIYKGKGSSDYLVNTDRQHDLNDCIFLPLSLYTQDGTNGLNFIISDENNANFIKFNNGNLDIECENLTLIKSKTITAQAEQLATIKGQLVTIQSAQTTLKAVLQNLAGILAGATTQTNNSHNHATFSPDDKGALNAWSSSLNNLFKD